jgi:transitional endoplasmic reticulum ATPase
MITDDAHKDILVEDYRRHRSQADTHRERGENDRAARQYRKAADLLDEVADLEGSDAVADERRDLAANLRTVADRLEAADPARVTDTNSTGPAGSDADGHADEPSSRQAIDDENAGPDATAFLDDPPNLDFGDVGGMTDLKQTLLEKVVDPLEREELYREYDLGVVNAVLLHGPPGTGKTYVTKALAGELGYNYVEVGPADVTSSLVGEAAQNVAELFAVARDNQPCLLFVDEIEALVPSRSGGAQKTQSERQMVNQYLQEVSATKGEDVILVAATNLPEEIDGAAASRFEERIEVAPPDATAREAILKVHLRERPVVTDEIDWGRVRTLTDGYSARDLENVAAGAARRALAEARGSDDLQPITQSHLETAVEHTDCTLDDWRD